MDEFTGCKLAYLHQGKLLVYQRDENNTIPFPGRLDFPGGGREGMESAQQCVLRELKEEFSICLPPSRLIYQKKVPNQKNDSFTYFFVALGTQQEIDAIEFGNEGVYWELMSIDDYLNHPDAIPALINRLLEYLASESLDNST